MYAILAFLSAIGLKINNLFLYGLYLFVCFMLICIFFVILFSVMEIGEWRTFNEILCSNLTKKSRMIACKLLNTVEPSMAQILMARLPRLFRTRYTPGIYAAGYIVFALTFVRSSVRMFVRSFVCSFVRYFPSRS